MNRVIVFLAVLVSLAASSFAQTSQIATLQHQGEVKFFYGASALKEAGEIASSGDVITLSPGQFEAMDWREKAVDGLTVRGAGMGLACGDKIYTPTEITGAEYSGSGIINYENIVFKTNVNLGANAKTSFYKCTIKTLYATSKQHIDVNLFNCYVVLISNYIGMATVTAVNSVIRELNSSEGSSFQNCVIGKIGVTYSTQQFVNCILGNMVNDNACSYQYCVVLGTTENPFTTEDGLVNTNSAFNGTPYVEGSFYELSDELKTKASSDGTQIGIYGGNIGFDPTPSNPRITKFNVAPKTSADGKLSVDIEVAGVE